MRYLLLFVVSIFAGCGDWVKEKNKKTAVNQINSKINFLRKDGFPIYGFTLQDNSDSAKRSNSKHLIGHLYAKNITLNLTLITNTVNFSDEHIIFEVKFDYKSTYFKKAKPDRGQIIATVAFACDEEKWSLIKMELESPDLKGDLLVREKLLAEKVREHEEAADAEKDLKSSMYNPNYLLNIKTAEKNITELNRKRLIWIEMQKIQLQNSVADFFTE